ncbi:MAG: IMP dehydrogenase [Gammaproteobacteria bacterium]|nr:MAG: IMP dehydrogenase [Gammaproteobacteria bacterium]
MQTITTALTFDDVLLQPAYSNVLPSQTNLKTRLSKNITLNIPLISAAMDTVTEAKLSIAMAQEGGIGIIHKNFSIKRQADEVRKVKKYESGVVKDPITIEYNATISDVINLMTKNKISGVPVLKGTDLIGIVTRRDIRFAQNLNAPIETVMTPKHKLITVKEDASQDLIVKLLHEHRIEKLLMVDDNFHLLGLVTVKDIQKKTDNPNACQDKFGQLRVGAAVGTGDETNDRVAALVENGVDVIVVDTAHGHSQGVLDKVQWIKENYSQIDVIGGNIATAQAALDLVAAGADAVKVGIGPGSICTTRMVAGVGVPQITAVSDVAKALLDKNIPFIADGGIRYSGDMAKALCAGASSVMLGGMFAGCEEAPGEVELYQGRSYKSYRGMGSIAAMKKGSSDRYFQKLSENSPEKLVPEGIEGRVPYKGQLQQIIHQLLGGLRSSLGYIGCPDIKTAHKNARFVKITNAGIKESHVHDVSITKEAPNYRV